MKKVIAFCPSDANNLKHYKMMEASLRHFHSVAEIPLLLIDETKIRSYNDPMFYYRSTPIIAKELLNEYSTVIKMDCDQIILGRLDALLTDEPYDVAVVNNSNPRDFRTYPYQFMNINALSYVNCGLVVMKSKAFVDEWYDNCQSFLFGGVQMKEQDLLNILVHGNHYKVKRLDEGDSYYGMACKGYETEVILKDGKPFLDTGTDADKWPDKPKWIKVWHSGGGAGAPDKMNYRIKFQEPVIKFIDTLVK